MKHIPIVDTENHFQQIEVTHHNYDAPKGHWSKHKICLDNIKINFFIEGDFSIFVNDLRYRPVCGDICFFPPAQIHCGQVENQTRLNYFQLDIGVQALDCVSGGRALLQELQKCCNNDRFFLHPKPEDEKRITELCYRLESAVNDDNKTLAFAHVIEILTLVKNAYTESENMSFDTLSLPTKTAINYIKGHYHEKITAVQLSMVLGYSPAYLSSMFKKEIGMSIRSYLIEYRVVRAAELLKDHSVADTCYLCGFYDSSHFIAAFKKHFYCTPAVYKKQLPSIQR